MKEEKNKPSTERSTAEILGTFAGTMCGFIVGIAGFFILVKLSTGIDLAAQVWQSLLRCWSQFP